VYFSTEDELDECTNAGGELIQRKDDNEETISNRLNVYRENTEPLIDFYKQRDRLTTIDAEGAIDEVYERLLGAL
jgi:adenylate kinase